MMVKLAGLIYGWLLLWLIYWIGNEIVDLANLPIPGNVIGVLLLFCLLAGNIVKVGHIKKGADFLLRHLVFFFIPVTVSLMNWGQIFYNYKIELIFAVFISTLLPFWSVGYLTQLLQGKKKQCSN